MLSVVLFLLGFSSPAMALTHSEINQNYPAVVKLENDEHLTCTAEVVGLHPTTVLTAGHCLLENFTLLNGKEPTAAYTMAKNEDADSKDIAVLIYTQVDFSAAISSQQLFSVAPVPRKLGDKIQLCGFGSTATVLLDDDVPSDQLRCGINTLVGVGGQAAPVNSVQAPFSAGDLSLFQDILRTTAAGKFQLVVSVAEGTTLGPRSDQKVNINGGDSGGPWFTDDGPGGLHLSGISSWGAHLGNRIVASFALDLSSADAKLTLKNAVQEKGADIRGIRELLGP